MLEYNMLQYKKVKSLILQIKEELNHIGWWQADPIEDIYFDNLGPFGVNTMTPAQWLQFVFIPNVEKIIEHKEPFPESSSVAAWAAKNFDGYPESDKLLELLSCFDDLINN